MCFVAVLVSQTDVGVAHPVQRRVVVAIHNNAAILHVAWQRIQFDTDAFVVTGTLATAIVARS